MNEHSLAFTAGRLFALPLAISWILTALLIRWAPRLGLVDYPSERKVHTQPTPRGGGLAIFAAATLSSSLLLSSSDSRLFFFDSQYFLSVSIFLLGLFDDIRPLPWPIRLTVQFAVTVLAVLFCLPPGPWLVRAAAVVWIAGHINAFNMLDNMDALSGGVAWIAAGFFAVLSSLSTGSSLAEWGPFVVLMGALSGFLWFNRPPARIFMGDAGSTFLGFMLGLGSVRVALDFSAPPWSWLALLCILAVPCYDLLSVVLLRLSQGRSPFHADKQHLSHRLVNRGLSMGMAVRVIYLLALASGTSGVILYVVRDWTTAGLIIGQLTIWWTALAVMEFATKEHRHDTQAQNAGKTGP
jgi:UDP-GlcNAc:undecaprenyl-phosphate/decaprenyl-phosphate GlcNAc-1-phosphate transferase